jgi:hypothetical protein
MAAPDDNSAARGETRKRLWEAVQQAQEEHARLSAIFDSIIAEVPRGLPAPDGVLRIEEAGRARRFAFKKYQQALSKFTEFAVKSDGPNGN